jgi:hypothetical protein
MAKFYGAIGYAETVKTAPGVWREQITERKYAGDVLKNVSKTRDGENLNPNLVLENRLSIVADPFAYENFHAIRYVKWMGVKWQVSSVEVQRPRLILGVGQVYNEQTPTLKGGDDYG